MWFACQRTCSIIHTSNQLRKTSLSSWRLLINDIFFHSIQTYNLKILNYLNLEHQEFDLTMTYFSRGNQLHRRLRLYTYSYHEQFFRWQRPSLYMGRTDRLVRLGSVYYLIKSTKPLLKHGWCQVMIRSAVQLITNRW